MRLRVEMVAVVLVGLMVMGGGLAQVAPDAGRLVADAVSDAQVVVGSVEAPTVLVPDVEHLAERLGDELGATAELQPVLLDFVASGVDVVIRGVVRNSGDAAAMAYDVQLMVSVEDSEAVLRETVTIVDHQPRTDEEIVWPWPGASEGIYEVSLWVDVRDTVVEADGLDNILVARRAVEGNLEPDGTYLFEPRIDLDAALRNSPLYDTGIWDVAAIAGIVDAELPSGTPEAEPVSLMSVAWLHSNLGSSFGSAVPFDIVPGVKDTLLRLDGPGGPGTFVPLTFGDPSLFTMGDPMRLELTERSMRLQVLEEPTPLPDGSAAGVRFRHSFGRMCRNGSLGHVSGRV